MSVEAWKPGVSSAGHVIVLPTVDSRAAPRRLGWRAALVRALVEFAALAALGLYGVSRWNTLLSPGAGDRLLGMLGVLLALGFGGAFLARWSRVLALVLAVVALIAIFPLAGVPLSWVVHARIAVIADGIGEGLSALPRVLVPYNGINEWVRVVMLLGAGVLLLDAGLLLAFASPALGDARKAGAALPLVALAVVPATLVKPQYSYLQGLLLFGLLALFVWGDRIRRDDLATALAVCALAGVGGMIAAPALDRHKPWINYEALAGTFAPTHVYTFDWSQRYGPLHWPRTGHVVLEVKAGRATYWKAENLDGFDGHRWIAGIVSDAPPTLAVDRGALTRWTQTEQVTIRAMKTNTLIAAGAAAKPAHVSQAVVNGASPGTWAVNGELGPGDSYAVRVYSPDPTPAQLAAAGTQYPAAPGTQYPVAPSGSPDGSSSALSGYLTITIPGDSGSIRHGAGARARAARDIVFAPFGARTAPEASPPNGSSAAISQSPYAPAYALAQRLERGARTPYAYVMSVERFLANGFVYDENPPPRKYPLESFLLADRAGYCQQFAGAMALLLRMGGVPARVAAGFTSGVHDTTTNTWLVSDIDAHAWVEVWFPHYGWVTFDPTPVAAPARGGHVPIRPNTSVGLPATGLKPGLLHDVSSAPTGTLAARRRAGGPDVLLIIALLVALATAAGGAVTVVRRRTELGEDRLVLELERALRRTGRTIGPGVTLAALEQRFREAHEAAGYIRAVRLSRFGGRAELPTMEQRRALRAELRAGLGVIGRLRALWALPPRPRRHSYTR